MANDEKHVEYIFEINEPFFIFSDTENGRFRHRNVKKLHPVGCYLFFRFGKGAQVDNGFYVVFIDEKVSAFIGEVVDFRAAQQNSFANRVVCDIAEVIKIVQV